MQLYVVIDPTREEFKTRVAQAMLAEKPLLVTARERLDDLTARTRGPRDVKFQLKINSVHTVDGAFVIAELVDDSDAAVRLDVEADSVIMTVISSDEHTVPAP